MVNGLIWLQAAKVIKREYGFPIGIINLGKTGAED
jgi:hypothetical protein